MAENESLDPDNPYGRRWAGVFGAVRKGAPFHKVVLRVRQALYRALAKALSQAAERGVTLQVLLEQRNSPQALRRFIRSTEGHEYIQRFAAVAAASSLSDNEGLLREFVGAIWEAVSDHITVKVVRSDGPSSLNEMKDYLARAAQQIQPDVDLIARNLAANPSWKPRLPRGKNGQEAETTADLLSMSLLGVEEQ
ncbi:MAG: hypothetical protein ABSF26_22535 [Thermoguttaceae bacterium]|jgi:hypothetical protein